jgi:two-component system NtrC family response regulator
LNPYVLIVDDELAFRTMLEAAVTAAGFSAKTASSGEEALAFIEKAAPGLVFLDQRMGPKSMTGLETLEAIRERYQDVPVVMVTGFGDVQCAVAAMKSGALDFLEKPIDFGDLRRVLHEVLAVEGLEAPGPGRRSFGGIVPSGDAMQATLELLEACAQTDASVLITGESGTGKELAASFVHEHSGRKNGPFIKVNCAAIPASLLEGEMFGWESGAFTGAARSREGRFAAAHRGTLLLDEISEMSIDLQAKLLRAIQEKEYQPLGASRTRKSDARIIASANRSIPAAIAAGVFREDLYYRLNVFEVLLPPLRERVGDILPLSRRLMEELAADRPRRLAPDAAALLMAYHWPGNVRELRNALERAVILARGGVIHPEHLPPNVRGHAEHPQSQPSSSSLLRAGTSVQEMERALIVETLSATDGNRTRAAEILGMSRRALLYKIKRYGL